MGMNIYALLADIVVGIHFLYVMYVVLGQVAILVGWVIKARFIYHVWFRLTHLVAILIVALQAILRIPCPLTELEYFLRAKAGQTFYEGMSFLARLLRTIIFFNFAPWVFMLMYVGFGGLVLLTFIFIPPRRKKRVHAQ